MRVALRLLWLLCGLACACREHALSTLSSSVTLRYLPGCAPERVEALKLEALGDFGPDVAAPVAVSFSAGQPGRAPRLPYQTRWFRLSVETASFRGVALTPAGTQDQRLAALLLPLGTACSVLDQPLQAPEQSAMALAAGGDLLIAGGAGSHAAVARDDASLLSVDSPALEPVGRLYVARAGAAAVAVDDEVWILGGASAVADGSEAVDTFERYLPDRRAFLVGEGRLSEPRVGASALRLQDGSLLLAGGSNAVGGAPLAALESIASAERDAERWPKALPFAAASVSLRLQDDGQVLVAAFDGRFRLALLDPRARDLEELSAPELEPGVALAPELTVALPGTRFALFELDAEGHTSGRLWLRLADGGYLSLGDAPAQGAPAFWLASFAGVADARTLPLTDGRILLTGVRQGAPLARVLDLSKREVAVRELDLRVEQLFARSDGSVLLVGPDGARVLREDARTPFDNPGGTLLADDSGALCLDAYGRFTRAGLTLEASVAGARFDIAGLRYRDVRIELSVEGPARLLLRRADGGERAIEVGTARVGPAYCELAVDAGDPISIERREQHISLRAGKSARSCVLDGLSGPIALALSALEAGVTVRELRVLRL